MSKFLIEQIRTCLCLPGKVKPAANKLTNGQLIEVFNRLRRGESPNEIARFAQERWNFMEGRTPHTVGQAIRVLQKRISHLLILGSPPAESPPTNPLTVVTVGQGGLEELQQLHGELLSRMRRLLDQEKATGIPYKDAAKDALSVSSLAGTLMKMKTFELTRIDPLEIQRQQQARDEMLKKFDNIMQGTMREGGQTVIAAANRFLELAEQNAITLEEAECGTWKH